MIVLLLNRRNSWPTPPAGRIKGIRRRQALPPLVVDPADVTVLGQVESGKGESSDRGKTPSKKKKS